jgi:hypothetical protein
MTVDQMLLVKPNQLTTQSQNPGPRQDHSVELPKSVTNSAWPVLVFAPMWRRYVVGGRHRCHTGNPGKWISINRLGVE